MRHLTNKIATISLAFIISAANIISPVFAEDFFADETISNQNESEYSQNDFFVDMTEDGSLSDDFLIESEPQVQEDYTYDYVDDQTLEEDSGMRGSFMAGNSLAYEAIDLSTPTARVLDYNKPMTETEYYVDYTLEDGTTEGDLNHSFTICMIQNIPQQSDGTDLSSLEMTVDIPSNFYEGVKVYRGLNNNGGTDRTDDFNIVRNADSLVISPKDVSADWLYGSTLYIEIKPGFAPKDVVPKKYTWNEYSYTMTTSAVKGTLTANKESNPFVLHVLSRDITIDQPVMSANGDGDVEHTVDMSSDTSVENRTFTLVERQNLPSVDAGCEFDSIQMTSFVPDDVTGISFYVDHQEADEKFTYNINNGFLTIDVKNPHDHSLYGKELRAEIGVTVPQTTTSSDYVYHVTTEISQGGDVLDIAKPASEDFTLHVVNPVPLLGGLKLYFEGSSTTVKQMNPSASRDFAYQVKQNVIDSASVPFTEYEMALTVDGVVSTGEVTVMQDSVDITDKFSVDKTGNIVTVKLDDAQGFENKEFIFTIPAFIASTETKTPLLASAVSVAKINSHVVERESNSASLILTGGTINDYDTDLGTGTGNQIDKMVGENSVMAFDKYISEPTGTFNNQNTYNITIEQAYFSDNPINITLPSPQDVILVLDASGSMEANQKVAHVNESANVLFQSLATENVKRKADWDAGKYPGIKDDDHDYVDDVTGERLADHLLTMRAVIGYNVRSWTKWSGSMVPETASDVNTLYNAAYIRNGYMPAGDLWDFTRTDLAIKRAQTYIENPDSTNIILITDGEPFGEGPEGNETWDGVKNTVNHLMMTSSNTNAALTTAKEIKDNGGSIYTVYVQPSNTQTVNIIRNKIGYRMDRVLDTQNDANLGLAFCMLMSNDSPRNGLFEIGGSDGKTFTGNYDGGGRYGLYTYFPSTSTDIVQSMTDIVGNIRISGGSVSEYANPQSYILDNITRPFNYTDGTARVYKVPRINRNGSFEWGDRIDITNEVTLITRGQKSVIVKGFDYAANQVTDFNKNLAPGDTEPEVSAPGDYGYKLVLEFGIYAEKSFGGNSIITNDDETSGFYPSTPKGYYTYEGGHKVYHDPDPEWIDNTSLNPDRNEYITLYPVPQVDLFVDYEIVSDDMIIYAPQTAKIMNLVSDINGELFLEETGYQDARLNLNDKRLAMNIAYDKYDEAMSNCATDSSAEAREKLLQTLTAYNDAQTEYTDALEIFNNYTTYIPDGFNNAYVDIHYELLDPDDILLGTMDIAHGENCSDESGRITKEWTFTDPDAKIQKSGSYTINCTVSPVDTTKAENETGSTEAGSQSPRNLTKNPNARIFVLKITAKDTSIEPEQAVDFPEGTRNMKTLANSGDVHIVSYEWVCTDGVTPSNPADEPGNGNRKVGDDANGELAIPEGASGSVKQISGRTAASGDEPYIPVQILLSRAAGQLDKDVPIGQDVFQTTRYFSDSDHLYGDDSSVIWEHICTIVDDCDHNEFDEAQTHNTTVAGKQNNVRFLVHVTSEPRPVIHKTTSTPQIIQGSGADIKWQVTLENNNEVINPAHLNSSFSMVDVLPYVGDERLDPHTGLEGSSFSGDLYYKTAVFNFANSPEAQAPAKYYYTTNPAVRSDERDEIMGAGWTEITTYSTDGTQVTMTLPQEAIAIRMDTTMAFAASSLITVDLTANIINLTDQQIDDFYLNEAHVITKSKVNSEVVKTIVKNLRIRGVVWVDANKNGLRDTAEERVKNVTVNLYKAHSPGGEIAINIDGTDYDVVYDANENRVQYVKTNENGEFEFNNLNEGVYFIVASDINNKLTITRKNIGTNPEIDSDAEETAPFENGAFINNVPVSETVDSDHNDIGLYPVTGKIIINKTVDDIYFPAGLTAEQQDDYFVIFTFALRNIATGQTVRQHVVLNKNKKNETVEFSDLDLGQYEVTEDVSMGYSLESMQKVSGNVTISPEKASVSLTPDQSAAEINVRNTGDTPRGVEKAVINFIPMHDPIQLRLVYTGPPVISDNTASTYTFTNSDVYGIVTYDDGTTNRVELSDLTLSPAVITNAMNTGDGTMTVSGYYTERGITLEDNFQVGVDLKPIHKMTITFKANNDKNIRFANNTDTNRVRYAYNELNGENYVLSGQYEALGSSTYHFMGWNTAQDGHGIQYDDESAINALGADPSISTLTLYASWGADVTFDANEGAFTDSSTSKTVTYILNDYVATSLRPEKTNCEFIGWNTKANATGDWLDAETRCTAPMKFYAIYLQTEFPFTASVQTFTAPFSGTYKLFTWGAQGGGANAPWNQSSGGVGGYSEGTIHLNTGDKLYVFVGGQGQAAQMNVYSGGGWNGGGNGAGTYIGGGPCPGYGGGGMTHISTTNNLSISTQEWDPTGTLIVAGGGGGADDSYGHAGGENDGRGGWGGGTTGGPGYQDGAGDNSTIAGQTYGYAQGRGGQPTQMFDYGGGGAGWWGGKCNRIGGGAGGSGWVGGVQNGRTLPGTEYFASPTGGSERGHAGNGYARITIVEYD